MAAERYLVAARKYRPALFRELVAQEHVTETLENAIRMDRLAHAYLFSGPRGVGKTTAARILAKAINCETPLDEREDEAEPCRTCASCRAFEEGRSLGIFEIDAASNNKVDDIRELRETVRIPPQGSKRKVYIIDEVHMLSNQAFNALLKTLEEPPPHVLFIFATTEPHKVLPTILSRCQRFDFRRIPLEDITERLREICRAEEITADEESLTLLARKGDGALRDALSAFDQAVSLCGTTLAYAELAPALGVVDQDLFFRLTEHVAAQQSAAVLRLVEHVVRTGHDLHEFLAGVAEHVRNLLVARTMDDMDLIEAAEATRARYAEQAAAFSENDLLRLLIIAGDAEQDVKQSTQPRLKLEVALLKMARLPGTMDLRKALDRLDRLEQRARAGTLPAAAQETTAQETTAQESPPPEAAAPSTVTSPEEAATPEETAAPDDHATPNAAAANDVPADADSADADSANADSADADSADAATEDSFGEEASSENTFERPAGAAPTVSEPAPPPPAETDEHVSEGGEVGDSSAAGYRDLFGQPALQRARPPEDDGSGDGLSTGDGNAPLDQTRPAPAPRSETALPEGALAEAALAAPSPAAALAVPGAPEPSAPKPGAGASHVTASPVAVDEHWPRFVGAVAGHQLRAILNDARPLAVEAHTLRVAVRSPYHQHVLREHHDALMGCLPDPLRAPLEQLQFVVRTDLGADAAGETAPQTNPYEVLQTMRAEHPVVRAIFDEFGGELAH